MEGTTLGRYEILQKIGAGGMGVVYRARDTHLDREVAVKLMPPGSLAAEAARRRFRREALSLSQLNHPNVATVHDFGTHDGVDYLVMELVPGVSLDERIAAGPLEEREVLRIGLQAAAGLEAAHARGVIHCDVKLQNLRLTPDGRVKVLDFGLARSLQTDAATAVTQTDDGAVVGTLASMAPEVLGGQPADPRSDLYSLGIVLYQMATGRAPFVGDSALSLMYSILNRPPESPRTLNPALSAGLESAILRAIDRDPARRHASVRELAEALEHLVVARTSTQPATMGTLDSIAVLPLENLSGDPGQEFFADGMTEALIAGLAKLGGLRVISRTSAMRYKGTRKPLPEIARELRVDAVLEGSVVRSGSRVRVTAQLIHATTDEHMWAESYERPLDDILVLQGELARTIATHVRGTLAPEAAARSSGERSIDPGAYEAYLKGREQTYRRTPESLFRGVESLRRALEREPDWALAWTALSEAYDLIGYYSYLPPGEAFPVAAAAARRALEIDPLLGPAHVALAYAQHYHEWDWAASEASYRRGLELAPGYALGHVWFMNLLTTLGRFEEALAETARAAELDPLSSVAMACQALVRYYAHDYPRVLEALRVGRERGNLPPSWRMYEGWALDCGGDAAAAIRTFEEAIEQGGRTPILALSLARAHARNGDAGTARRLLQEVQRGAEGSYVDSWLLAPVWEALGDVDRGLEALERAFAERSHWMVFLADARLDGLRGDPRFDDLARRVLAGGRE